MKKLFIVGITADMLVWAESSTEAREIANDHLHDADFDFTTYGVKKTDRHLGEVPYGAVITVERLLAGDDPDTEDEPNRKAWRVTYLGNDWLTDGYEVVWVDDPAGDPECAAAIAKANAKQAQSAVSGKGG